MSLKLCFCLVALALLIASSFAGPEDGFDELADKDFKGCILQEAPYVVPDTTRKSGYSGVAMAYLARLQENLGFTITYEPWTKTWKEFISIMKTCNYEADECPCDIGIGSFTMTNQRAEDIWFVAPFSNEAHQMVSRKSDLRVDDSQDTWFVFRTFSPQVWVIIFFGIVMHAFGTIFFGPFRPPEHVTRSTERRFGGMNVQDLIWQIKRFPAAVVFAYAHLVGHPFGEASQRTPSFHRSAWLVLGVTTGLFLLTIYEASLTVLLFESTRESPFRSLQDIRNCVIHPDRVAMISGGASQDFWNKAVNITEFREACSDWGRGGVTVENIDDGFAAVKSGEVDYFFTLEGSIHVRANMNCEGFARVGQPFFSTSVAFVMANKTKKEYHRLLSRETRILREQDAFETARTIAERTDCDSVVDSRITSGKLWAFFAMYVATWSGLLLYRCVFLWRRKKRGKISNESGSGSGGIIHMNMHSMPTRGIPGVRPPTPPGDSRTDSSFDPFDDNSRNRFPPVLAAPSVPAGYSRFLRTAPPHHGAGDIVLSSTGAFAPQLYQGWPPPPLSYPVAPGAFSPFPVDYPGSDVQRPLPPGNPSQPWHDGVSVLRRDGPVPPPPKDSHQSPPNEALSPTSDESPPLPDASVPPPWDETLPPPSEESLSPSLDGPQSSAPDDESPSFRSESPPSQPGDEPPSLVPQAALERSQSLLPEAHPQSPPPPLPPGRSEYSPRRFHVQ